jgi:protein SCO1/2
MLKGLNLSPMRVVSVVAWLGLLIVAVLLVTGPGSGPAQIQQGGMVIPAFSLVDQNGKATTEKNLLGRPSVIFFGFTFCPEVCPTTLADLTSVLGQMGETADGLNVVFVTVDPERDTPEALKAYVQPFDPRIRALTGAPDQIAKLARSLGIYVAKVDEGSGSYTVDHTASILLIDATGRFQGTISYRESRDVALAKLQRLAAPAGG